MTVGFVIILFKYLSRLGCVDTVDWGNGVILSSSSRGVSCFEYEMWQWCANGNFTPGNQWAGGSGFNYPEYSCCACGKGLSCSSLYTTDTLCIPK
jgi:hypothetical protein